VSIRAITGSCRGKKTTLTKNPVEIKSESENEFGNQDSLLKYKTPPVISKKTKDTLLIKKIINNVTMASICSRVAFSNCRSKPF
jgi:hypothetical protein